jgi:hypothetical protein
MTIAERPVEIVEQLTEVLDRRMGQRQVLALAQYTDDNKPIMLKIRYEYIRYVGLDRSQYLSDLRIL